MVNLALERKHLRQHLEGFTLQDFQEYLG